MGYIFTFLWSIGGLFPACFARFTLTFYLNLCIIRRLFNRFFASFFLLEEVRENEVNGSIDANPFGCSFDLYTIIRYASLLTDTTIEYLSASKCGNRNNS